MKTVLRSSASSFTAARRFPSRRRNGSPRRPEDWGCFSFPGNPARTNHSGVCRSPFRPPRSRRGCNAALTVNTTTGFCHLEVVNGWLTLDWDETKVTVPGSMAEDWFKDHADPALPATDPVELSRAIHSPLIDHLLTDLMNHPAPPVAGAAVTKNADTATEREKVGAEHGQEGAHPRAKAAHHARRST